MNLYWTTNLAAIKGHIQWQRTKARREVEAGQHLNAQLTLMQLIQDLPSLERQLNRVRQRINNADNLDWAPAKEAHRWSGQGFRDFDLQQQRKQIRQQLEELPGKEDIPDAIFQ